MAYITDVRELRGLMEISADGSVLLRVRKKHFEKLPVHPGEELDPEEYLDRLAGIQFPDAYEAALTSLDFSARTAREIGQALRRKGYVQPAIDAVIARLTESRLIDDRRYAERLAETTARKPVGVYAMKRKLKAKGISDEDAEAALGAFDEAQQRQAARAAAEKLARKYADMPVREGKAKLSQALARRGFPWDAVKEAVEAALGDDGWEE